MNVLNAVRFIFILSAGRALSKKATRGTVRCAKLAGTGVSGIVKPVGSAAMVPPYPAMVAAKNLPTLWSRPE